MCEGPRRESRALTRGGALVVWTPASSSVPRALTCGGARRDAGSVSLDAGCLTIHARISAQTSRLRVNPFRVIR